MIADLAAAEQAVGFACKLNEGIIPVAPLVAVLPLAVVNGLVVVADVQAGFKHQGDGELADGVAAVVGHVAHGNALLLGIGDVHHVIAGGKYRDELDVRALVQRRTRDGGLVHHNNLCVTDALGNERGFRVGGAVIDRYIAELLQLAPAQIAGIFRIAVEYNNFHGLVSLLYFC